MAGSRDSQSALMLIGPQWGHRRTYSCTGPFLSALTSPGSHTPVGAGRCVKTTQTTRTECGEGSLEKGMAKVRDGE